MDAPNAPHHSPNGLGYHRAGRSTSASSWTSTPSSSRCVPSSPCGVCCVPPGRGVRTNQTTTPATPSDAWRVCGSAAEGILIVICACVYVCVSLHVLLHSDGLSTTAYWRTPSVSAFPWPPCSLFCVYRAPIQAAAFTITTIIVVVSITPPLRPARPSKKCVANEKGCSVLWGEGGRKEMCGCTCTLTSSWSGGP